MTAGYLPLAEAARRIGRSRDTLRRWVAQGRLRAVRLPDANGRLYVALADLGLAEVPAAAPGAVPGRRKRRPRENDEAERFLKEEGVL